MTVDDAYSTGGTQSSSLINDAGLVTVDLFKRALHYANRESSCPCEASRHSSQTSCRVSEDAASEEGEEGQLGLDWSVGLVQLVNRVHTCN